MTMYEANSMSTPETDHKPPTAQAPDALPQPPAAFGARHAPNLTDDLERDDLEISLRNRGYVRSPLQNEKIRRFVSE
jgi:hypothetical protein